ncbi:MAG: DUF192 domain-containing protein [Armatimonadetes bacterium]|nr:DUF192 domain-containing protein [Armatimonadota bacterium]
MASDARWLASFVERGRGWLFRSPDPNLALAIPLTEGERLHSIGVRFPLEIAYCDASGKVLHTLTLPPFRIAPAVAGAVVAWEWVAGKREGITVMVGETLQCD